MEQLAPHERVFVNTRALANDPNHGSLSCEFCHGGDPSDPDWRTAHEGVSGDPSYPAESNVCATCHADVASGYAASLHYSLQPYRRAIDLRSSLRAGERSQVSAAMDTHCLTCHSSCGQCHVSRPGSIGGGLLAGHAYKRKPPMQQVCTGCHGSRIEREYFGKNEGVPKDVHREKYMDCVDCHSGEEMHGDGTAYPNRYAVASAPQCRDCHEAIYAEGAENSLAHNQHKGTVSCQVCHAGEYKNCYECHVGKDADGLAYFKTRPSTMGFKIGLNPNKTDRHPETFVTVRHIPADPDLFAYYLDGALERFDAVPTWKMATPHTIRRQTPQNKSCDSCHGRTELFLQPSDVEPEYLEANRPVIVPADRIP